MDTHNLLELQARLTRTTIEHAKLDAEIAQMRESAPGAELLIRRLKKRKLKLKEEIHRLKSILESDIIA